MASTLMVPVARVHNLRVHPNAAMLGLADVLGYQMVVGFVEDPNGPISRWFLKDKRDEKGKRVPVVESKPGEECPGHDFYVQDRDGVRVGVGKPDVEEVRFSFRQKEGELVVYIPADTILPDEWAVKMDVKSLLKGGNRVGKIALRGEPSYGILASIPDDKVGVWQEGDNVADYYGITKWEPPVKVAAGDAAAYDSDIDPYFDKFTDIQNGRIFVDVFKPGEEVVVSEKIHGCLHADTKVMLANGEEVRISDVAPGTHVVGYNPETGNLVPSKVLKTIRREVVVGQQWVRMWFGDRSVVCTSDHLFLTRNRGWVVASDLATTDDIVEGF